MERKDGVVKVERRWKGKRNVKGRDGEHTVRSRWVGEEKCERQREKDDYVDWREKEWRREAQKER